MCRIILCIICVFSMCISCAPTATTPQGDLVPKPEEIYTFSVPASSLSREIKDTKPDILKGFPFVAYQPVVNFRGKFPPEFYSRIKQRWSAEPLKSADLWRLRNDHYLYDVLYSGPMWIGDLQLKEGDLLKNIVNSYNISSEQFKVLEDWVKDGGILWIESAIYISSYDYNLNHFTDEKLKDLAEKIRAMTILGNKVNVTVKTARRIDEFNTERLSLVISPEENIVRHIEVLDKQIRDLLLEQTDYVGIYVTVQGEPLVKSGDATYASYVNYGKGKIITLAPFDFKNVQYDGELLRLDLLLWALNDRK